MKMNKLVLLASTSVLVALVGTSSVQAADVTQDKNQTTNTVLFEADDSATLPVDPTDPTKPVDPTSPPDEPGNPATSNKGPLSLDSLPNLEFGTEKIAGGAVEYNVDNTNPFIQVTDKRGTGTGWAVSATAGKFTAVDSSSRNPELKGYTLSFENGSMVTSSTTPDIAPTTSDFTLEEGKLTPVMSASDNSGRGTWLAVYSGTAGDNNKIKLHLTQPGDAEAYAMTIDWTLSDTPTAP